MKQLLPKQLLIAFCILLSINAKAINATIDCLRYDLAGTVATVIGYDANTIPEELVIPETVEYNGLTFTVTKIDAGAFLLCDKIVSVTVPTTVSQIGETYDHGYNFSGVGSNYNGYYDQNKGGGTYYIAYGAFRKCDNLRKVILSNTTLIGVRSFERCDKLEEVVLKGCVTICNYAFNQCHSLKTIDFGERLTTIEGGSTSGVINGPFSYCTSLTNIVLPATINKIGSYSFYGCDLVQNVIYLGDNVVSTGLSNINTYTRRNMISWISNTFTYTGSAPTPIFTNNLPTGFQPKNGIILPELEKNVGSYNTVIPVTFVNNNIEFNVNIPYSYTIEPVTLTARVKDTSRIYGENNPKLESEYFGFVTGEDESVILDEGTYSTSATASSAVGTYIITQTGVTAKNYAVTYEPGTLTVTKAPLTMTARNKTMDYGSRVPTLEVDYAGLKNSEAKPAWTVEPTITTEASPTSDAGTYSIVISGAEAKNYNVTVKPGTMTVRKVALTATTMNASREYGDENPDFELTYSGLKNDETAPAWTVEPTFTTPATKTSPVGTYSISASGGEAKNYYVDFVNTGKLTVEKAPLRATARSLTKVQGESNPTLIIDYEGFKNGETPDVLIKEPTVTTTATKNSRIGTYSITVKDGEAANYEFEYVGGTLTVVEDPSIVVTTDDRITVNEVNTRKGKTVEVAIGLENQSSDLTAYQFELTLPAGFTIAKNAKGKFLVTKGDRYEDDEQSLTVTDQGDGIYRFVCFSLENGVIEGTSGALLTVSVDVADDMEAGTYQASVGNIVLTKKGGLQQKTAVVRFNIVVDNVIMGDANGDEEVNVTDIVEMVNCIMSRPSARFVEAAADLNGDGEVNVTDIVLVVNIIMAADGNGSRTSIQGQWASTANDQLALTGAVGQPFGLWLTNEAAYVASQFDIRLSAGQTLESIALNNSRAGGHLLTCEEIADGLYRVVVCSLTGNAYRGDSGELLTISVKGQGEVAVEKILFVTADAAEKRFADLHSGTTAISTARLLAAPADVYTTDGRMVRSQATSLDGLKKGVYIVNGRKEVVR